MPQLIIPVPVTRLAIHPRNARTDEAAVDDPSIVALAASMERVGQLQPIVVTQNGDGMYLIIIGSRRWRAAQRAGMPTLNAIEVGDDEAEIVAASAAENLARKPMNIVDQWRAIGRLCDEHGWEMSVAAAAIGVDPDATPRLRLLSRMHPAILDLIRAAPDLPPRNLMRDIANAPLEMQQQAVDEATKRPGPTNWQMIATACYVRRIPRAYALFEPLTSWLVWEEDLFASPEDPMRVTTADIAGFMQAQRAEAKIIADAAKGHRQVLEIPPGKKATDCIPGDMRPATGEKIPGRWLKADPRVVCMMLHTGGATMGMVEEILCYPKGYKPPVDGEAQAQAQAPLTGGGVPDTTKAREPLDKPTRRQLAQIKAAVFQAALRFQIRKLHTDEMLRLMLLALLADNVHIDGGMHDIGNAIARKLLLPSGAPNPDFSEDDVRELAYEVLARIAVFPAPDTKASAGAAAEWLALAVGVQMPRCDTAEILHGVAHEELVRLATEAGINSAGSATMLRNRLAGQLPNWRPDSFHPADSFWLKWEEEAEA